MSDDIQQGSVQESDLSPSERAALIAFKTALNERLPTIIPETSQMTINANGNPSDESFVYLLNNYVLNDHLLSGKPELQAIKDLYAALPEKAQPVALPEQAAATNMVALSESERALVAFKQALNKRLPEILPETAGMAINENGNALDGSFAYLMDSYVLNESQIAKTPALAELRDQYNTLPADIRAKADTYRSFFADPSTAAATKNQEQSVVALAERYLGTNDAAPERDETGTLQIDVKTSRALRERMEQLKASGELETDFDPRVFDKRSVDALNELVQKRMQGAGVAPSALDGMLVQMWLLGPNGVPGETGDGTAAPSRASMALGEAVSLRNIMSFMVNADLPSGGTATKPDTDINWDTQWSNNDSGDRFFSSYVYRDLYNTKTVTTDVLFDEPGYSEENYAILLKAAERVGVDMTRGRVMSEIEVGEIATEILSIKAQDAWCMINPDKPFDEKDIHQMIHDRKFMPHIDDLALAEKGFGLPQTEFFRKKLEEYGPEETWRLEYEQRTASISHRVAAFSERFGDIPEDAVAAKAARYSESEDHIRHSYGTPSLYFGSARSLFGSTKQTEYEHDRDEYLKRYQEFKEDIGTCNPSAAGLNNGVDGNPNVNGTNGPCTVEGVLRGDTFTKQATPDETACDCIKTNVEDATGNEQGDCTVEDEVNNRMNRTVEDAPSAP